MRGEWVFLLRYGSAVVGIALALAVRLLLDPILGGQFYSVIFLLALVGIAWWAGRGPSILALVLGLLAADFFFAEPRYSLGPGGATELIGLALFACTGIAIILVAELQGTRHAYRQMKADNQQLFTLKERLEQEIDDRKRVEEDLKRLAETLEQRVFERTAVAEQRAVQLRVLAAELTQTEEHERRRLAKVLHDHLQQLLVAARMKVAALRRRTEDERLIQPLGQLDEVLTEAITESRSLTVELSPPALYDAGLGAGLAWLAQQTQEKQGLLVEVHADPRAEPTDESTRVFLFQAVRELLLNVVKHAKASSARVELVPLDDGRLRLVVADTGVGFDQSAGPSRGSPSGFGLFSIRERLELLGGRLEVATVPAQGSRVTIELSQGRPSASLVVAPSEPSGTITRNDVCPVDESWPTRPRKTRVVLADDHAIVRQGVAEMLREHGEIEVVGEAADGRQAVEVVLRTHPDVVLMDITMPVLSGIEATRRILDVLSEVRVIGLSMHGEADMATAMGKAGAVAYLSKDTAFTSLLATILAQPAVASSAS